MQRKHTLFLIALTALLGFSALSGWQFAMGKMVERVIGPLLSLHSAREHWEFLLTAVLAALVASGISAMISYWVFVERRRGERALRRQLKSASVLHQIAVAANEAESAEEALLVSLEQVCAHLEWPAGQVYVPGSGDTPQLVPSGLWHLGDKELFAEFHKAVGQGSYAPGEGLPGRAWTSGKPEMAADVLVESPPDQGGQTKVLDLRPGLAVPVVVNDAITAVMIFYATEPEAEGAQILEVMATVGAQVGRALERKQTELDLRAANDQLADEALTKRKLNEALSKAWDAALESERQYRELAENSPAGIWRITPKGKTLFANPAMAALLEVDDQDAIKNVSCLSLLSQDSLGVLLREFVTWSRGERSTCEVKLLGNRSGKHRNVEMSGAPQLSAEGKVLSFLVTVTDITERKQVDKSAWKLAHQDPLTGLPSRQLFVERLADLARTATRQDRFFALMLLDIEGLKAINDEHGHPFGDALLRGMAEQLCTVVRETDTVGRFDHHDFAILITNLKDTNPVHIMTRRIIEQLSRPRTLNTCPIKPEINVGISFYGSDSTDPRELIAMAEVALGRAKADGGSRYHLHDAALHRAVKAQELLEDELHLALERGEFLLHYQPQFDLRSNEVVGAEVLIRWQHPLRGVLASADWMPAAETGGLMVPVGDWALRQACAQSRDWQSAGLVSFPFAVNISAGQFRDEGLVSKVEAALADSGLDARCLALEISESMATDGLEQITAKLQRLKDLGTTITLDGFGSGYMSLSDLKHFPIQRLKIGADLIKGVPGDGDAAAIVEAAIKLGHSFGLSVIAVGVETREQLAFLANLECDEVQGFYFGRALPADDFADWIALRPRPTRTAQGSPPSEPAEPRPQSTSA